MLTRQKKKILQSGSSVVSQYNQRNRDKIKIDDGLDEKSDSKIDEGLLDELHDVSEGKCVILDEKMIHELKSHNYKKHLQACSLPMPNTDKVKMKTSVDSEEITPEYVVYMIWDNKDNIIMEDARVFINKIYDISKLLFDKLVIEAPKLPYFEEYYKYVTISASELTEDSFDRQIVGCIAELFEDNHNVLPARYKHVYINGMSEEYGIKNAMINGLLYKVDHIDTEIIKSGKTIQESIASAVDAGYRGGEVAISQIARILTEGRDDKETATEFGMAMWKQDALRNGELLNRRRNAQQMAVDVFWQQFGLCLRSHLNHLHFKPYSFKMKIFHVSGLVFYGNNGIEAKLKDANVDIGTNSFNRQGSRFTKYDASLTQQQIHRFINVQYHTSTKSKGGHIGWTYYLSELKFNWDNQKCNLKTSLRVEAVDPNGVQINA